MLGLSKLFGKLFSRKTPRADVSPWAESLKWLPASENPFGVDVLDCRVLAEGARVTIRNGDIADHFYDSRADNGRDYIGKLPANAVAIPCALCLKGKRELKTGPVYRADQPEIKWDIFLYESALYFVRSWSGDLVFKADVKLEGKTVSVSQIFASPEMLGNTPAIAVEQVKYLIKSHLFNEMYPHPVPVGFSKDPREIALYSVTCYGSKALFATFDKPEM